MMKENTLSNPHLVQLVTGAGGKYAVIFIISSY